MIDYPIDLDTSETSQYDPFLHHVIRHKLRKKKNRRRLGRLLRKHPKARILRSIGIGRRRRRTRPVRRVVGRRERPVGRRYRTPIGRPRPPRRILVSRSDTIKKPFRMPPIKFGNPMHRDLEGNKGISKIGVRKPYWKGPPIMPGDPSKRNTPPIVSDKKRQPKVSKDIVIPYKRRYGSGKRRAAPIPKRIPKETVMPRAEELPVGQQDMITKSVEVMKKIEGNQKPQAKDNKRKMRNIIGVAVLGLAVAGFVMYKMKTKIEANGRTS
ncbi:hypothetical protein [uncultured Aquimarina sp.]|uniref:hypothetical protein n=1 Tax=uncultured Aquimarina sp. TaxID=575652 RepID=UPI00262C96AA|nr:hypothetical protein [uncultured Aquimarina sp.]